MKTASTILLKYFSSLDYSLVPVREKFMKGEKASHHMYHL